MADYRSLTGFLLAVLLILSGPTAQAMDRKTVLEARDQERVIVIRATVPRPAARIYALLHDWSQRKGFQKAPTFDHWEVAADSPIGIGAWAEYDLRLGDQVIREHQVIADDVAPRYVRERSDRPQLPYEVHWLLDPIGDGATTAVTIAIHIPQNRNWLANLSQQWTVEPALRAAYEPLPARIAAALAATP